MRPLASTRQLSCRQSSRGVGVDPSDSSRRHSPQWRTFARRTRSTPFTLVHGRAKGLGGGRPAPARNRKLGSSDRPRIRGRPAAADIPLFGLLSRRRSSAVTPNRLVPRYRAVPPNSMVPTVMQAPIAPTSAMTGSRAMTAGGSRTPGRVVVLTSRPPRWGQRSSQLNRYRRRRTAGNATGGSPARRTLYPMTRLPGPMSTTSCTGPTEALRAGQPGAALPDPPSHHPRRTVAAHGRPGRSLDGPTPAAAGRAPSPAA